MSDKKTLIFFGQHTTDWIHTLTSSDLLSHLNKYVSDISSVSRVDQIPKSDVDSESESKTVVIPLMENHAIALYKHGIYATHGIHIIMPKLDNILTFGNKYLF